MLLRAYKYKGSILLDANDYAWFLFSDEMIKPDQQALQFTSLFVTLQQRNSMVLQFEIAGMYSLHED
jgi:hypothetical protein